VTLTLTDAAGQRDSDTFNLIGIDGRPTEQPRSTP
jgi:hypothetical protein